jgi:IS4 transposase
VATTVGAAVAARTSQVHGVAELKRGTREIDGVARLVRSGVDTHLAAGELQHLGHERQRFTISGHVQRPQNLLAASHPDELAPQGPRFAMIG